MKKNLISILTLLFSTVSAQYTISHDPIEFAPVSVGNIDSIEVSLTSDIAQTVSFTWVGGEAFYLSTESIIYEEAGDTEIFTIYFEPDLGPGNYNDSFTITGSIFGTQSINVSGEATLVEIAVSSNSYDFGEVSLGDSTSTSINISNNGTGTMVVYPITSSNAQFYSAHDSLSISTGNSENIIVWFKPTLAGVHSAELSLSSNDPNNPIVTVSLVGSGVTNISGEVSGTWSPENSPYYIVGDTQINNNESLTILPGVSVLFEDDYDFSIYGSLFAEGTLEDSIYFIGNSGGEISFDDSDMDEINLKYVSLNGFYSNVNETGVFNFENTSQLNGWSVEGQNSDWGITDNQSYSGNYSFIHYYSSSWSWYNAYVYSPKFKVTDDNAMISFRYLTDWYNNNNGETTFYIKVNDGSWENFYTEGSENWSNWDLISLDVSQFASEGDEIQIQLNTYFYYWFYTYYDDFSFIGLEVKQEDLHSKGPSLKFYNYQESIINVDNSSIQNSKYHAIYLQSCRNTKLSISETDIIGTKSGQHGIYIHSNNNEFIKTSIESSNILNVGGNGYYSDEEYDTLFVYDSKINNNANKGIYHNRSYSPVEIINSTINGNLDEGVFTVNTGSPIKITDSEISDNAKDGVYTGGSYSPITVYSSIIRNNGYKGLFTYESVSPIQIYRSLIVNNGSSSSSGYGVYTREDLSQISLNYSTVVDNNRYGVYAGSQTHSKVFVSNSIVYLNNSEGAQIYGSSGGQFSYSNLQNATAGVIGNGSMVYHDIIYGDPYFIDEDYRVAINSNTVDAANPNDQDANMPPGSGGIRADMGIYGGPGNHVWGGDTIPSGSPYIDIIQDLPQDQGGMVGIMYEASVFDYDHTAYSIDQYSFWRAMNISRSNNIEFSTVPNTMHLLTQNEYWEQVGTMPAQGFENYGFSAQTLGDSTSSTGIFWSKFLVVAHTNDEDVYFYSEPDSGYSIDNLPPFAPAMLNMSIGENGILTASWEVPENTDLLHYEVFRDGAIYLTTEESQFEDQFSLGESHAYSVRGIDVNGNIGEQSQLFDISYGILGDITWDGNVDVIDVLAVAEMIINNEDGYTEQERWAAEMNNDGVVDVFDLIYVVDYIMSGASRRLLSEAGTVNIYKKENTVYMSSDSDVNGLQFTFSAPVSNLNTVTSLDIFSGQSNALLVSLNGMSLNGNDIALFDLPDGIEINEVKASGVGGIAHNVNLGAIPDQFAVYQNYPNPFNPSTQIRIDLSDLTKLTVKVFDANGREVLELINREMIPGFHTVNWDGKDITGQKVSSGIYFFRVITPETVKTIKALLVR